MERWYNFPEFGGYLRNVGSEQFQLGGTERHRELTAPDPDLVEVGDVQIGRDHVDLGAVIAFEGTELCILAVSIMTQCHMGVGRAVEREVTAQADHPLAILKENAGGAGGDVTARAME